MKISNSHRGISIIGTVATMIILSLFGLALLAIVSTDQESWRRQVERAQTFYNFQAGAEYARREIDQGGTPVVIKPFQAGDFAIRIDPLTHSVSVTASRGESKLSHQYRSPLGMDCLVVTPAGRGEGLGDGHREVRDVRLRKGSCVRALTLDRLQVSWEPGGTERLLRVEVDDQTVFDDPNGVASGGVADLRDFRIADSSNHKIEEMEFNRDMRNKRLTITIFLTDTSFVTQQIQL